MAKIFTITEGLENLGALKSGGQGSVYKARKTGEIITAIKILPTPIASESDDDKHFISFQNEVQKLKKVNEIPNPNVVSIIASGITSSGNLPYIEMEYIEGPDLGDLLKPPYDPVFTVKETIKVADQLANALAHCHRANIKHGDIKSNNVKFNQHTGNYILLDFGLSVMSDEQRRTSIRYAGAIEFMAPEQSSGETLTETDVYSFGIVLFELLTGNVPFPLMNKSEMARNTVMVAHMETLPPDVISLRRQALPGYWSNEKQQREMEIPVWLLSMIYKCLEKDPAKRFKNGGELQEFIHLGTIGDERKKGINLSLGEKATIQADESALKKEILTLQTRLAEKEELLKDLQYLVDTRDKELIEAQYYSATKRRGVSKSLFFLVLIAALGLAGFAAYDTFYKPGKPIPTDTVAQTDNKLPETTDSITAVTDKPIKKVREKLKKNSNTRTLATSQMPVKKLAPVPDSTSGGDKVYTGDKFTILNTAYFYDAPDKFRRTAIYLTPGDATLTLSGETDEFRYAVFTDDKGRAIKGWLLKKDFKPASDY
ncbi:serine/threonine protein kinase [Ginsengibacter hankyongi]|uniref:Serine/threonine protein kinase n=1 Tax=Ginsengibacter hankyongi TaxID=2607284 RepID=A0A5J5INQ4_9BACT|nr:serine/threonine-protein kinase [Ginsengibacter hankyongi]KAA9042158.1 serine/threonine protein kinase [Ginsengibacter hankyongi]